MKCIAPKCIRYSDILLGRKDPENPKTLVELYAEHNAQVWSLVGVDFAEVTAKKFDTSLLRLKEYLAYNYKTDDITLEKVDNQFVTYITTYSLNPLWPPPQFCAQTP